MLSQVTLCMVTAVLTAAVTTGCTHPSDPASATSAASAAESTSVVAQPVLPACDKVSISFEPKMPDQHIRCTLTVDDHTTVDVSSDPAWSFTLKDGGTTTQEFREATDEIGETGAAPLLQDIDHDGTPELLVVTGRGGTGGEPMAVWRLTGQPRKFVRAGEIFGFRTFYRTPEGFFGNYAHSGAGAGDVTLYRWDGDKLAEAIVLDVQVLDWPKSSTDKREWIRNGNVDCTLNDSDYPPGAAEKRTAAMQAAGIDPATAAQQFCNQPWVATLYR